MLIGNNDCRRARTVKIALVLCLVVVVAHRNLRRDGIDDACECLPCAVTDAVVHTKLHRNIPVIFFRQNNKFCTQALRYFLAEGAIACKCKQRSALRLCPVAKNGVVNGLYSGANAIYDCILHLHFYIHIFIKNGFIFHFCAKNTDNRSFSIHNHPIRANKIHISRHITQSCVHNRLGIFF